jgi:hypothetical protein
MLRIISLGAGVQSTTMALMAAHGEITPMPDCAVFADTQAEPKAVYQHLRWLMSPNVLPFPVHVVTAGSLTNEIGAARKTGKFPKMPLPAYVKGGGLLNRSCTQDYKIEPIRRKVRQLAGIYRKRSPREQVVEQWIGISQDEAMRMKPSREAWQSNRWPLIEKKMTRQDCLKWVKAHDYPIPPKSSCTYCPFHSDEQWRLLTSDELAEAVEVDKRIRNLRSGQRSAGETFLHRSCVPLGEIDFWKPAPLPEPDLFGNECEGVCGV